MIFIESIKVCAIKNPMPEDSPCVFTSKTAIYFSKVEYFDDDKGPILMTNKPLAVCDKTGNTNVVLNKNDIFIP
jgi:hypothetical protein